MSAQIARLLQILRPSSGLMIVLEGYFDESGSFDEAPGIFCISGYLISTTNAEAMDQEWRAVLADHGLPYFHMVDCAHEPPSGVFEGKDRNERIEIVKKFIALIKKYTIEGVSFFARDKSYQEPRADTPDVYSDCASGAAFTVLNLLKANEASGGIAYFFESGHPKGASALAYISQKLKREGDSITFAGKTDIPLLQAADLLAWQSAKYAKDYFYPSKVDGVAYIRLPRADFSSLMEHPHMFFHLGSGINGDNQEVMGIEIWPMHRRIMRPDGAAFTVDKTGPISFIREEADGVPLFPVNQVLGWGIGAAESASVLIEGFESQKYALHLDEMRLFKLLGALMEATAIFENNNVVPITPVERLALVNSENKKFMYLKLRDGATLGFELTDELAESLISQAKSLV